MKDFLKRVFGRGKNLPPKLPKHMKMTDLTMDSIPPPIPSNKGSGLPMGGLPPPFPKGAFVVGAVGFGALPPPLPTTSSNQDGDLDDLLEANFNETNESTSQAANPLYGTSGVLDL